MKYKGKAQAVAEQIVDAFRHGDVPEALAQVFVHRQNSDTPSSKWSWTNRLLVSIQGHHDARGFRQWKTAGRSVKKGEKACYILAPWTVKAKEDDPERDRKKGDPIVIGYVSVPVFGFRQTEGEPLPGSEEQAAFVDSLPLVEVARAWDIDITTYSGKHSGRLGYYSYRVRLGAESDAPHDQLIGLGVKNLSTWAHELVHAADNRLGTFTRTPGQRLDNEVVAELGGAVLLECLGFDVDSDRGGAWDYVERYAKEHRRPPVSVCTDLLDRVADCVALILDTADEVNAAPADAAEPRSAVHA